MFVLDPEEFAGKASDHQLPVAHVTNLDTNEDFFLQRISVGLPDLHGDSMIYTL
jgi:hypothetical protein